MNDERWIGGIGTGPPCTAAAAQARNEAMLGRSTARSTVARVGTASVEQGQSPAQLPTNSSRSAAFIGTE